MWSVNRLTLFLKVQRLITPYDRLLRKHLHSSTILTISITCHFILLLRHLGGKYCTCVWYKRLKDYVTRCTFKGETNTYGKSNQTKISLILTSCTWCTVLHPMYVHFSNITHILFSIILNARLVIVYFYSVVKDLKSLTLHHWQNLTPWATSYLWRLRFYMEKKR